MNLYNMFKTVNNLSLMSVALVIMCILLVSYPGQAHAGRADPMYVPATIDIDCNITAKQVKNIIRSTLQSVEHESAAIPFVWGGGGGTKRGRGWIPTNKSHNLIEARLIVRSHTLVADILYDRKSVNISYKDSDNLNYSEKKNGTKYLHGNANKWLRTLESDLRMGMSKGCNNPNTVNQAGSRNTAPSSSGSGNCSVNKILQLKDIGMSDAQIHAACGQ